MGSEVNSMQRFTSRTSRWAFCVPDEQAGKVTIDRLGGQKVAIIRHAIENRLMMFWMTLCFNGFLRIGELLALRKNDITVDASQGRMELVIRRSKTEQFSLGESTFIFRTSGNSSPWNYVDVLEIMNDDDYIVLGLPEK